MLPGGHINKFLMGHEREREQEQTLGDLVLLTDVSDMP